MTTPTDKIYSAYLAYLSYNGLPMTFTEETLAKMLEDVKTLCAEYGVEAN